MTRAAMHACALAVLAAAGVGAGCRSRPLPAKDGEMLDAGNGGASRGDGAADQRPGERGPLANGESCAVAGDCASGFCVKATIGENTRVCCDAECGSGCSSCDLSGTNGTCVPIPAGRTPRFPSVCTFFSSGIVCYDGLCDGAGGCRSLAAGITCRAASCDGDTALGPTVCDGRGKCVPTTMQNCAPYACFRGRCGDGCVTDDDCVGAPCQPDGRCSLDPEPPGGDAGAD
jgi:hypothetical protein